MVIPNGNPLFRLPQFNETTDKNDEVLIVGKYSSINLVYPVFLLLTNAVFVCPIVTDPYKQPGEDDSDEDAFIVGKSHTKYKITHSILDQR